MKAYSKRTFIAFLAAVLLIVSSVGATVAYFSDNDEAKGDAKLSLQAQTKIDEGTNDYKAIKVTNTGECDVLVRVKLFGVEDNIMTVSVPDNWVAGDEGWYYYSSILSPGKDTGNEITVKLKDKVDAKVIAAFGDSLNVTIIHEATPVVYEGKTLSVPSGWKLPSGVPSK